MMPYFLAGFTKYDVMVVGGGGGKGGEVQATVGGVLYRYYGAGGGGGSFIRKKGLVKNLIYNAPHDPFGNYPPLRYGAGAAGVMGANRTPIGTAGSSTAGTDGGYSYFGYYNDSGYYTDADCPGGTGGQGATIQNGNITYGIAGSGGYPSFDGYAGGGSGQDWTTLATNGTYAEYTDLWLGSGGGGALGKIMEGGTTPIIPRAGAQGAYHASLGAAYRCPGEAIGGTNYAGGGGGVNIAPWTGGGAEYRGRGGANAIERAGAVLLRLT